MATTWSTALSVVSAAALAAPLAWTFNGGTDTPATATQHPLTGYEGVSLLDDEASDAHTWLFALLAASLLAVVIVGLWLRSRPSAGSSVASSFDKEPSRPSPRTPEKWTSPRTPVKGTSPRTPGKEESPREVFENNMCSLRSTETAAALEAVSSLTRCLADERSQRVDAEAVAEELRTQLSEARERLKERNEQFEVQTARFERTYREAQKMGEILNSARGSARSARSVRSARSHNSDDVVIRGAVRTPLAEINAGPIISLPSPRKPVLANAARFTPRKQGGVQNLKYWRAREASLPMTRDDYDDDENRATTATSGCES